ncbi:non-homologous end joining protein Ku [Edaphobacter acidisoli]|uniref:Non-homologous end joining protein Ku n=1 Tax=Edaphobacter acidisoli TaxID=2040573 RepID=A0A916VZ54_9BACT|nr:non-homologous end joining protein Ku [Edaphobacter acidisoli]
MRHQKVLASALEDAPDEAAAPVEKDEIVKGYEYSKGQYVIVEPSELAALRVPSKHAISVTQFVGLDELSPEYMEKPYFVVPEDDVQAEAFAVVRKALQKAKKAAIGKIAFGGREHVIAITADDDDKLGGMMAYTMRYQEELRSPAEYFKDIKKVAVNADSLALAMDLIKKKAAKFDPGKFTDGYEAAVRELVEAKIKHAPVPQEEVASPRRANVVNLMDALRKSLSSDEAVAGKKKPVASVKGEARKSLSLVKPAKGTGKRKSA